MAKKDEIKEGTLNPNEGKLKALQAAMAKIEKDFGKGSIMKLGDEHIENIEVIPTGSIALDMALGVGGYPKGRIIEIYGPESSGKTTLARAATDAVQERLKDQEPAADAAEEESEDETYITSPIVGTFYSAPSPEAKAFVKVGDRVKAGQTVCILEAMKLMNEIESDFDCEIEAVLVSNEQKIEYGQPLFKVKKLDD